MVDNLLDSPVVANVEVPRIAGLVATFGRISRHDSLGRTFAEGEFLRALIGHSRAVPYDVERQQQPILIVGEGRIDVLLDRIALAIEL